MKSFLTITFVVLALSLSLFAQPASKGSFARHALAKVGKAAVTPVVHPAFFTKATLGSVLFIVENGVDGVHGALFLADKGFTAASANGKIPVLDNIAAFVGTADKDSGKLDTWLERQERYLFGTNN